MIGVGGEGEEVEGVVRGHRIAGDAGDAGAEDGGAIRAVGENATGQARQRHVEFAQRGVVGEGEAGDRDRLIGRGVEERQIERVERGADVLAEGEAKRGLRMPKSKLEEVTTGAAAVEAPVSKVKVGSRPYCAIASLARIIAQRPSS